MMSEIKLEGFIQLFHFKHFLNTFIEHILLRNIHIIINYHVSFNDPKSCKEKINIYICLNLKLKSLITSKVTIMLLLKLL